MRTGSEDGRDWRNVTQFLPQLVQQNFGYAATWAGLLLSPGGVVTMVMMIVVGRWGAKVQPKYLIVAGALLVAASMHGMTNVYADLGFWFVARSRMLLGIGLPLIFIPLMTASYDGIAQSKTDQASALINAARNTGGSIGVSTQAKSPSTPNGIDRTSFLPAEPISAFSPSRLTADGRFRITPIVDGP